MALAAGCEDDSADDEVTPESLRADVEVEFRDHIEEQLVEALQALAQLQRSAPPPDPDPDLGGWNSVTHAQQLLDMRRAWSTANAAYHSAAVGLIAMGIDPQLWIEPAFETATAQDDFAFDGVGFTGLQAIERILWADSPRADVQAYESSFAHYHLARFPENAAEAQAFSRELVQKSIDDLSSAFNTTRATPLSAEMAFQALLAGLDWQFATLSAAQAASVESRYARDGLTSLRAQMQATRTLYDSLSWWLRAIPGHDVDHAFYTSELSKLESAYDGLDGQLPDIPATWSGDHPSISDEQTLYGRLWKLLEGATDRQSPTSLHNQLLDLGRTLELVP